MKKTLKNAVVIIISLLIFCLLTCTTNEPKEQIKTAEKKQPVPDWEIKLTGIRDTVLRGKDCYYKAKEHTSHYREMTLESKGKEHTYKGMPFHLVIAMADGNDKSIHLFLTGIYGHRAMT